MSEGGQRRRRIGVRRVGAVVLALTVSLTVAGCGGDDDPYADFCSTAKEVREPLGDALSAGQQTGLLKALPYLERLQKQAPRDIADDYAVVTSRIEALSAALADADVDAADYDRTKPPAGVSAEERAAIDEAAKGLSSAQMQEAFSAILQQARDVCRTPLTLS